MKVPAKLQMQAYAANMTVDADPYDIGYFKRYFGWRRPTNSDGERGFQDCTDDLAADGPEAHPNAVHELWS